MHVAILSDIRNSPSMHRLDVMTTNVGYGYAFSIDSGGDDALKRDLQQMLNEYHAEVYPAMTTPQSRQITIRVTDQEGQLVGGAIVWIYWGWLEISVLALQKEVRGQGLGRRLMTEIEELARKEGCTRARVEAFERETGFYQHLGYEVLGCLEDYPEGYNYYWLRKDLLAQGEK
ncbi:MAG: GNAT family N-acetyltransferase [Anaerolineae bacterium]|nr:GNAT family N-acetyltransferase [Anaerolineae bacterium]